MKWIVLLFMLAGLPAFSLEDDAPAGQSQSLKPTMRAVDRDWDYFKAVNCEDIAHIVFHSRSEELLLAKRKAQCLDKYKAFLPVPVDR